MSKTPRTDAERRRLKRSKTFPSEPVDADFCRAFEHENAKLRAGIAEAARDADAALRKCLNYMLRLPLSGSDAECEAMDDAHHALRKLQPFLKP